jgi:hydroxyethylthiazole kinase-like uncharacterized protein yjeF
VTIELEPLLDRAQSRQVDQTLAARGVVTALLMENAGRGAAEHVARIARARGVRHIDVLCGPGNNGGDGLVVTRHLLTQGFVARAFALEPLSRWSGDAAIMRDALLAVAPTAIVHWDDGADGVVADAPLVVDALFGTGLSRPLEGRAAQAVHSLIGRAVIALDCPSGLDIDTASALGAAPRAEATVAFATSKPGLHTGEGLMLAGEVFVAHLGFVAPISDERTWLVRRCALEPRARQTHKGTAGRVLVVAGSDGTAGAGWLSCLGAHRGGAGLVTLATRARDRASPILETMTLALSNDEREAVSALSVAAERADCIVVGPGLGRDPWARAMVDAVVASSAPLVVDADALSLIAEGPTPLRSQTILTPHPLEAARMLGQSSAIAINADRFGAAREIARRFEAVTLLKGAGTIIAHPDGRAWVLPFAEPTLAVAGSGDVLAGVIGARLAERSASPTWHEAAIEAAYAHGAAGAALRATRGSGRGALAHEIADAIRFDERS